VVHHFTIKPVIYGSIAAWIAGVPRIINTITGLGFVFTDNRPLLRRIVESLYSVALRRTSLTFFQNPEDRKLFVDKRLVAAEKTSIVPGSGVDAAHFVVSNVMRGHDDSGRRIVFLMMSRLLKDKGILEFIQAARIVKSAFPEASFRLLGERDQRNPSAVTAEDIERWCREGVVEWLGKVADVRPYIDDADVIVLPSYREGTPRSLLEGAAMGKALIATDIAGCRQVIEHGLNGLLVPVRDVRSLADAMVALIRDQGLRERMGKAGRERVEREFDERIVIRKTLAAYGMPLPA
jgi:glycosyltransferase involved in cell wall biosynthesis